MPPNLTNPNRMGSWRGKHFRREKYFKQLDELQNVGLLPAPPSAPLKKAVGLVTMYLGSEMDSDNSASRCKWIWDWLKTRGYIVDDRRKNLVLESYPQQRIKRDKNYRVEITLSELAA